MRIIFNKTNGYGRQTISKTVTGLSGPIRGMKPLGRSVAVKVRKGRR